MLNLFKLRWVKPLDVFLAAVLTILVVSVLANVILRLFFHSGIIATEEVSRILLIWLVMIGSVAALHEGGHLGMNLLVMRLSPAWQFATAIVVCLLMLACDLLLLFGAWRQLQLSRFDSYPVTGIPLSVIYLAGVVAAVLFLLISGTRLVKLLTRRLVATEFLSPGSSSSGNGGPRDFE